MKLSSIYLYYYHIGYAQPSAQPSHKWFWASEVSEA